MMELIFDLIYSLIIVIGLIVFSFVALQIIEAWEQSKVMNSIREITELSIKASSKMTSKSVQHSKEITELSIKASSRMASETAQYFKEIAKIYTKALSTESQDSIQQASPDHDKQYN